MTVKKKVPQQRGRQVRGILTREKIVACALKLVTEFGISHVRFSDISKATKIPQPLIDYHFPSLSSLHLAMIQTEVQKLMALTVDAVEKNQKSPRKALMAYVDVPFKLAERDKQFRSLWMAYYHLATVDKDLSDFNTTIQKTGRERITNMVRALLIAERKNLKPSFEVETLASSIHGIITGYAIMAMTHSKGDFRFWSSLAVTNCEILIAAAVR